MIVGLPASPPAGRAVGCRTEALFAAFVWHAEEQGAGTDLGRRLVLWSACVLIAVVLTVRFVRWRRRRHDASLGALKTLRDVFYAGAASPGLSVALHDYVAWDDRSGCGFGRAVDLGFGAMGLFVTVESAGSSERVAIARLRRVGTLGELDDAAICADLRGRMLATDATATRGWRDQEYLGAVALVAADRFRAAGLQTLLSAPPAHDPTLQSTIAAWRRIGHHEAAATLAEARNGLQWAESGGQPLTEELPQFEEILRRDLQNLEASVAAWVRARPTAPSGQARSPSRDAG